MAQTADHPQRSLAQLEKFSHEPLRQRVASMLREAILNGTLHPGAPLVEQAIADELAISRAPVREAIRILAEEGLVESVPYKRSSVLRLSSRDVQEVYSMRRLLERFAVRRIIESGGHGRLEALEQACQAMTQAANSRDFKLLNDADERFHRSLIELADHELLLDIWTLIAQRARHAMALRNVQMGDPHVVAANHRAIVDALAAVDLELGLELVTAHVDSGAQLVLEEWTLDA